MAFKDPADALELKVQYGIACDVLDSNGTLMSIKLLEKAVYDYDSGKEVKMIPKTKVEIYTDGSSMNPGAGGYAGIILFKLKNGTIKKKTIRNCELTSTNNSMELKAVIESIKSLKRPCDVTVYTDSQYICTCVLHDKSWFEKKDKKNQDLWFEYLTTTLAGKHNIKFVKIPGHSGNHYNELCDKYAREEMLKAKHEILKRMES